MAPTKTLTHLECLQKICIICHLSKPNLETLSENLIKNIEENEIVRNVSANYNAKSICSTCRKDGIAGEDGKWKSTSVQILKDRRNASQPSIDELMCFKFRLKEDEKKTTAKTYQIEGKISSI